MHQLHSFTYCIYRLCVKWNTNTHVVFLFAFFHNKILLKENNKKKTENKKENKCRAKLQTGTDENKWICLLEKWNRKCKPCPTALVVLKCDSTLVYTSINQFNSTVFYIARIATRFFYSIQQNLWHNGFVMQYLSKRLQFFNIFFL